MANRPKFQRDGIHSALAKEPISEPAEFTVSDYLENLDDRWNKLLEENAELRSRVQKLEMNMDRIFADWRDYGVEF